MSGAEQPRGRPRDRRIDEEVPRATRELLAELGYAGVTVDAVARVAGVSKAAIYRRFGSKAEMVFTATVHRLDLSGPTDTGALGTDLRAAAHRIHGTMSNPLAVEFIPALMVEVGRDPGLADRMRQNFLAAQQNLFAVILDRAVDRGELPVRPDPAVTNLLLAGALFYAVVAFRLPLDERRLDELADQVTTGLLPR